MSRMRSILSKYLTHHHHHSTEMASFKILNDIYIASGQHQPTLLISSVLLEPFDTTLDKFLCAIGSAVTPQSRQSVLSHNSCSKAVEFTT